MLRGTTCKSDTPLDGPLAGLRVWLGSKPVCISVELVLMLEPPVPLSIGALLLKVICRLFGVPVHN